METHEHVIKTIADDQKEMRSAFLGGFAGQLVSGVIWLAAAGISVVNKPVSGMLILFFGCMLIFPLTQLTLRAMGRNAKVSKDNRLWSLGSQIAFTVPINFLLVGAIIIFRPIWFFPAAMIIVGSHYLPFMTLYGMKLFGILAALLILSGAGLLLYGPPVFSLGGWLTGILLIVFAFLGKAAVKKEETSADIKVHGV
ncbi:hypothetical protein SAMN04488100_11843 [Alkalibacterium putridalgicola]|uniref:Uncharacterized protein n=1 Tax=Alkalibacterium putridalgicola TaxID=426703 RepID=A0A1H7UKV8_9LACT|nr:hypothetical protein [Alkalibacterium putridalgicola]GEK88244.1 hypothetical protein APU01nite_02830 [Alkalibacterium putridalgicola]SEL97670.1 hypothetical protein SAMN04488100_11843 [Alkalibacterium putridalgicola]